MVGMTQVISMVCTRVRYHTDRRGVRHEVAREELHRVLFAPHSTTVETDAREETVRTANLYMRTRIRPDVISGDIIVIPENIPGGGTWQVWGHPEEWVNHRTGACAGVVIPIRAQEG